MTATDRVTPVVIQRAYASSVALHHCGILTRYSDDGRCVYWQLAKRVFGV